MSLPTMPYSVLVGWDAGFTHASMVSAVLKSKPAWLLSSMDRYWLEIELRTIEYRLAAVTRLIWSTTFAATITTTPIAHNGRQTFSLDYSLILLAKGKRML